MDIKIVLLLVLATSILMFGCAGKGKQQDVTEPPEISAPADSQPAAADEEPVDVPSETVDQPAEQPSEEPVEEPTADASDDSALADLFQIDTEKPISDEGLDVSTPSSD